MIRLKKYWLIIGVIVLAIALMGIFMQDVGAKDADPQPFDVTIANDPDNPILVYGELPFSGVADVNVTNSSLPVSGSVDANITNASLNDDTNITNSSLPVEVNFTGTAEDPA